MWRTWVGYEVGTPHQTCRRVLTAEETGEVRLCGGAVHTCYIRVGSRGVWTRAGHVCRDCGHFWPNPASRLTLKGLRLRAATQDEIERWKQDRFRQ